MYDLSVTKANTLIDASYKLNVQAQKLVLACLGKVDSRPDSIIAKEVTITAKEYGAIMGVAHPRRDLYKAADALFRSSVFLKENGEHIEIRWIQKKATKIRGEGAITIVWSDDI